MGWIVSDQPLRDQSPTQVLRRAATFRSALAEQTVLAAEEVAGTVYMAVHRHERTGRHRGQRYVFCVLVLVFNTAEQGFGQRWLSEMTAPQEIDCPGHVFAQLSPVEAIPEPGFAALWRGAVRRRLAEQQTVQLALQGLRPGRRIRLLHRVVLDGGAVTATEFEVVTAARWRRRAVFRPVHYNLLCRLPEPMLIEASRCPPDPELPPQLALPL